METAQLGQQEGRAEPEVSKQCQGAWKPSQTAATQQERILSQNASQSCTDCDQPDVSLRLQGKRNKLLQ